MHKVALRLIAKFLYLTFSFFTKRDLVILISSSSSTAFRNLPILAKALEFRGVKFRVLDSVISVENIYYLSKSKVVCIDQATKLTSNLRLRKSVEVIQLWHAGGAYKKFGFDACDGTFQDRKRIERIHGNTSWVITSSNNVRNVYAKAFGLPLEKVLPFGLLRTDQYFSIKNKKRNKRVVLFAPTFRTTNENRRYIKKLDATLSGLQRALSGTDYKLAVRLHPSISNECILNTVLEWSNRPLIDCLSETEVLITDYSSIFFDFSIFDGRIFWYLPDKEEYEFERGLYFNPLLEYPDYSATTISTLAELIKKNQVQNCPLIRKRFMDACDGRSTTRIVEFILSFL